MKWQTEREVFIELTDVGPLCADQGLQLATERLRAAPRHGRRRRCDLVHVLASVTLKRSFVIEPEPGVLVYSPGVTSATLTGLLR